MEPPGWVFTDLQLLLSLTELLLGAACCAVRCSRPVEQPHALGVGGAGSPGASVDSSPEHPVSGQYRWPAT